MESTEHIMNIFRHRLNQLVAETGQTQQQIAHDIGISSSALSNYMRGTDSNGKLRIPQVDTLVKMARALNTSPDYLTGITDVRSPDTTTKAVCDFVGLSEESITYLHSAATRTPYEDPVTGKTLFLHPYNDILSALIERFEETEFLESMAKYLNFVNRYNAFIGKHPPRSQGDNIPAEQDATNDIRYLETIASAYCQVYGFSLEPLKDAVYLQRERVIDIVRTMLNDIVKEVTAETEPDPGTNTTE